jgi:hypothetical protein
VTVNPGGALTVVNSQITGGITANAPGFFSLCRTKVAGPTPAPTVTNAPVAIRVGDPAMGWAGNQFAGQVVLTGKFAVTFGANTVSQGATINKQRPWSDRRQGQQLVRYPGLQREQPAADQCRHGEHRGGQDRAMHRTLRRPANPQRVGASAERPGQCWA